MFCLKCHVASYAKTLIFQAVAVNKAERSSHQLSRCTDVGLQSRGEAVVERPRFSAPTAFGSVIREQLLVVLAFNERMYSKLCYTEFKYVHIQLACRYKNAKCPLRRYYFGCCFVLIGHVLSQSSAMDLVKDLHFIECCPIAFDGFLLLFAGSMTI